MKIPTILLTSAVPELQLVCWITLLAFPRPLISPTLKPSIFLRAGRKNWPEFQVDCSASDIYIMYVYIYII